MMKTLLDLPRSLGCFRHRGSGVCGLLLGITLLAVPPSKLLLEEWAEHRCAVAFQAHLRFGAGARAARACGRR